MLLRRLTLVAVILFLIVVLPGCYPSDQQAAHELGDLLHEELDRETQSLRQKAADKFAELAGLAKEEARSVFGELLEKIENPDSVFADLVDEQEQDAPFIPPTTGYIGLEYKQAYPDGSLHTGIDVWASETGRNGEQRGSPVYAVLGGKLGRTGSGVEICHPALDLALYPDLPSSLVCTYYGHLTDFPDEIAALRKDGCPANRIDVEQGDLLGFMDIPRNSNNGIVHLHFSVVKQNPDNGCWTDERVMVNTLPPLLYLGLEDREYGWLVEFP